MARYKLSGKVRFQSFAISYSLPSLSFLLQHARMMGGEISIVDGFMVVQLIGTLKNVTYI